MEETLKNLEGDFCVIPAECLKNMINTVKNPMTSCPMFGGDMPKKIYRKAINSTDIINKTINNFFLGITVFIFIILLLFVLCENNKECNNKEENNYFNFLEEIEYVIDEKITEKMKTLCSLHKKCPEMDKVHKNNYPFKNENISEDDEEEEEEEDDEEEEEEEEEIKK